MKAVLFVIATPIGNLKDISERMIETLKECDVIACEDTRHTLGLLTHAGIHKPLLRYDEHSHDRQSQQILRLLEQGKKVGLVSDAGTPGLSDPGARLVKLVREKKFPVVPIPGPSALIAALSGSGLGSDGFVFLGFLPRKKGPALKRLRQALGLGKTVAVFESPFRIVATLEWLEELVPGPWVIVARELTKIHEEYVEGDASSVRSILAGREKIGECVILINGKGVESIKNENQ